MWSFARVELGLSTREFYRLTFRQWEALRQRKEAADTRRDQMVEIMMAQMIAMIANTAFHGFKEPRQPKEFMVSPQVEQQRLAPRRRMNRKQIARNVERTMMQAMAYQKVQVERGMDR